MLVNNYHLIAFLVLGCILIINFEKSLFAKKINTKNIVINGLTFLIYILIINV